MKRWFGVIAMALTLAVSAAGRLGTLGAQQPNPARPTSPASASSDTMAGRGPAFFAIRASDGQQEDARNAPALKRRVSLTLIGIPLGMAVQAIADRAGLEATFSPETIPVGARVSMRADDVTVAAALRWVLVNARVNVLLQNDTHLTLVPQTSLAAIEDSSGALTGELVDRETGEPVPYGTVALLGTPLARFTDRTGHFRMARLVARRYVLRARQIGYSPVDSTVAVARDSTTHLTIRMHRVPAMLHLVRVTGHHKKGCVATGIPDSTVDPTLFAVFAQVRENIDRYNLLLEKYPFRYEREEMGALRIPERGDSLEYVDSVSYESEARRPYRVGGLIIRDSVVHSDSLFRDIGEGPASAAKEGGKPIYTDGLWVGRAHCPALLGPVTPTSSPGCVFVGMRTEVTSRRRLMALPTFADLVNPAFLAAHCFEYGGTTGKRSSRLIRVNFQPAKSIKSPDVSGSVYLDADSLLLRRAVFDMTRPEAAEPAIYGFTVRTTFREILPLVPIIDSVESVQPGGHGTLALGSQSLIAFGFEGPTPGEESATSTQRTIMANTPGRDTTAPNPAVTNTTRATAATKLALDPGVTRVRAVFPVDESCKPTPAVDTISTLLYATLHGRPPRGLSDSAWSTYTSGVVNALSEAFAIPDTLSLSTFSWPFEYAVRKDGPVPDRPVADLGTGPVRNPAVVPPIDSSTPRSGAIAVLVLDDVGQPVPFAAVRLAGTEARGRTDSIGFSRIRRLHPGAYLLQVRRIGYAPQDTIIRVHAGPAITTDTIYTGRVATRLAVVTVQGRNAGPFVTPMISTTVGLTLGADGTLKDAHLTASSTSRTADELVLGAVNRAAAAHALPKLEGTRDHADAISADLVVSMAEPAPGDQAVVLARLDAPAWPSTGAAELAKMSSLPSDILSDLTVASDTAALEFVVNDRGDALPATVRLDYSSTHSLSANNPKQAADRDRHVRRFADLLGKLRFDAGGIAGCRVPEFVRQALGYHLHDDGSP